MDDKYRQDMDNDTAAAKWLNKFNEEFVNASFKKGKGSKNLHKTDALKKDSYNRNNARNRCIYTREKAQGALNYIEDVKKGIEEEKTEYENELIEVIDNELFLKELEDFDNGSDESDGSTN